MLRSAAVSETEVRGRDERGAGPRVDAALVWLAHACVAGVWLAHCVALSRNVVDVPVGDDWRYLRSGSQLLPDDLDLSWLFLATNRTVYATGKLLDQLYFTYTPGSYAVQQQWTAAVVLGGCVGATALLLGRLALPAPWRVLGVLSTALLLQVQSYWGIARLAYHQALPVLALLAVVLLVTGRPRPGRLVALASLTLAGGLAYVSGALALTCAGAFLVAVALVLGPGGARARLLPGAGVVLAAGGLTLAIQLVLVERLTLDASQRATPLDWQFWHYGVHLVARAIGDVSTGPGSAAYAGALAALLLGATAAATARSLLRARRAGGLGPDALFAVTAGSLLIAVASYLVVVSYARGQPHVHDTVAGLAAAAKARFHYWWVTPLVPFALVAPHFLLRRPEPGAAEPARAGVRRWLAPVLLGGLLAWQQSPRPWSFDAYYERHAKRHESGVRCLRGLYAEPGRPIRCRALTIAALEGDLRGHVENARRRSLPFVRVLEPPGRTR